MSPELQNNVFFEFLNVIERHEMGKCTNLLFLKRLLDLLQVGQQANVCADLQTDQKMSFNKDSQY